MEAKNLRIGNIVRSKINGISKVEQIGSSINSEYVGGRSLEGNYWESSYLPVEITEQWLLRFSYKKDGPEFKINDNDRFSIYKPNGYDHFVFCDGLSVLTEKIKYVHQLQNLFFALTGTELEMKELV